MSPDQPDRWAAGAAYEPFVGRWSRPIARAFLNRLAIPPRATWVDIGCGTGAVTDTILTIADPARVDAFDPSAGFIAYAREHVPDPRAAFGIADARSLPLQDATVDAVVSGLMLNFVPQPRHRDHRDGPRRPAWRGRRSLRLGLSRRDPVDPQVLGCRGHTRQRRRRTGRRPAISTVRTVRASRHCSNGAGLLDVETFAIEVPTRFRDFDDYWTPFLGRQGPAPGYVGGLDERQRHALRSRLQSTLPTNADGSIELTARAWAVRGSKG